MKTSTLSRSTKPLKRSPLRTKPDAAKLTVKPKQRLKSRGPKMSPIRKSAKGEECTIELLGICNHNQETVVWCHENSYDAGKGMGMKARDERGAYGCCACHAVYDGQTKRPTWMTKEYVEQRFQIALDESQAILRRKGLL